MTASFVPPAAHRATWARRRREARLGHLLTPPRPRGFGGDRELRLAVPRPEPTAPASSTSSASTSWGRRAPTGRPKAGRWPCRQAAARRRVNRGALSWSRPRSRCRRGSDAVIGMCLAAAPGRASPASLFLLLYLGFYLPGPLRFRDRRESGSGPPVSPVARGSLGFRRVNLVDRATAGR